MSTSASSNASRCRRGQELADREVWFADLDHEILRLFVLTISNCLGTLKVYSSLPTLSSNLIFSAKINAKISGRCKLLIRGIHEGDQLQAGILPGATS